MSITRSLLFALCAAPAMHAAAADIPADIDRSFADYVALPDTLVPILESATDKASADAAADKLFAVLPKVYDTRSALQKIPALTPSTAAAVQEKYEREMRTGWGRVYAQIFRLQKVRCYDSVPFFKQFHTLCMMLDQ